MKIRKASIKDVNRLYELMDKTKEVHLTKNIYSKDFVKKIVKNPSTYAIVTEENKKIVGLLTAAIWKYLGASYCDMIIIDKNFRNKGVGKMLHSNYINFLKRNKISYVWGLAKPNNHKMEKILKKFKFKKRALCYYYDL